MTKLRKQRRKKVYKHNVNRKRLRNKIANKGNIGCTEVKNAWDQKKSVQANLGEMGLSYDPNITLAIPKKKKQLQEVLRANKQDLPEDDDTIIKRPTKTFVADALEADAKAPRRKMFRLPNSQVEWITYLLKKYGCDYKAMNKDSKNYYQETWKQLRQKVRTFKKIPEQYEKFLKENGLQPIDSGDENMTDDEL